MASEKQPSCLMDSPFRPLSEAVAEPRLHRDEKASQEAMPNLKTTPEGYQSFSAAWTLNSRPRRIALLLDDAQEEYRDYAQGILPNMIKLVEAFRGDDCPIFWSAWARSYDDGISNAMDRWYGPRGLRPDQPENALYVFQGKPGLEPLREIAPTDSERAKGRYYHSIMLDMFWCFNENKESYLDTQLKALDVDTVVIAGLWTDECIVATAYGASARGYDVVVVGDAVATATPHHEAALTVLNGTVSRVENTKDVVDYMNKEFVLGEPGAVKGTSHPDGRKE